MRALALLLAGAALSGCLNFDTQLDACIKAGKCQAATGGGGEPGGGGGGTTGGGGGGGGSGGGAGGGGSGGGSGGGAAAGPSLAGAASIDFGQVAVGDTLPRTYSFLNDGGAQTEPITLFADGGGLFAVTGVGCGNVPLSPTAACVVAIDATPQQLGSTTASLFIDGGPGAALTVTLSVEGVAAVTVNPTSQSFGTLLQASQATRFFTVTNASTGAQALTRDVTGDGFSLGAGGTCGPMLAARNSCTLEVRFSPNSDGPHSGTLEAAQGVTASLTGTGVSGGAVQFVQTDVDFGVIDAGSTLVNTVTLSNTGGAASGPITFSIPGASPRFFFDAGTCASGLASGATCPVSVGFRPQGPGEQQASLEASSASAGLAIVQLAGTGRVERTLTVISDGGTVTFSEPTGATCPGTCTQRYEDSFAPQNIFLEELADPGMAFSSWSGCQPVMGGCTVVMDQDRVVTATFAPLTPRLFLSVEDGGTASPTPGGTMCGAGCYDFAPGANVTVNATALRGYVFGGFNGDCSGAACQLVMNGPRSVSAAFSGPHNFVFVTNTTYASTALASGSLDAICANEAADAGLPAQSWRAWVSRAGMDIGADPAFTTAQGWIRVDGRPFADQLPVAGQGTVFYPPALTARGAPGSINLWTGTTTGGLEGDNCMGWTLGAGVTGILGSAWGGSWRWTDDARVDCGMAAGLLCLGTTHSSSLVIPQPPPDARMIFVTGQTYAVSGGMTADGYCQDEAGMAGLLGTWTAVLAQGTLAGNSALPSTQEPLYRPDGVLIAVRANDLRTGVAPLAPIEVTADGQHVDGPVWTGSNGVLDPASGTNCDDWSSTTAQATVGDSAVAGDRWWVRGSVLLGCNQLARLYCVR